MKSNVFKKIILVTTFVASILISQNSMAQVGLFVEPSVTYATGDSSVGYPPPANDSSGHLIGYGLGARLGIHIFDIVFVGVDGRYSQPHYTDSSGYDASTVSSNWGPVIGIQMPIVGLRVWSAAVVDGEVDPESSNGYDLKFNQATGYRVGAGFQFIAVSLNVEYQDLKYSNTNLQGVGPFTPGSNLDNTELKNKSWIVSVSFPIAL